jgi:transposase
MFARVKIAKNKDGSERRYLQIVESQRVGKTVRQKVLCHLGRVDALEIDALVKSLAKFAEKTAVIDAAESLFADWSKEYGPTLVFRKLWEKLGLHDILQSLLRDRAFVVDIEEAIYCMVLNRLTAPESKLGVSEWKDSVHREGFEDIKLNHLYKAIDFLNDNKEEIEERLFFRHTNLFTGNLDLLFFDTTSTYFEGGAGAFDLLEHGYSKDHRSDRLQVMIGVLMTQDGLPIAHHVFPGSTPDTDAFLEAMEDLKKRFHINRVIMVGDRGMMGQRTRDKLDELGFQYILGARMRSMKVSPEIINSPEPYAEVKENLLVKEVTLGDNRYIVCLNEKEAVRDKEVREHIAETLREKLKTSSVKDLIHNRGYKRYLTANDVKLVIDEEKLQKDALYDGIYMLQTNAELSAEEAALAYRDLWKVERAFRSLKTTLELRPVYHWKERRIYGHIVLCFLALVMQCQFQKLLRESAPESAPGIGLKETMTALDQVKVTKIRLGEKEFLVRNAIEGVAAAAFRAVGAAIPERVQILP